MSIRSTSPRALTFIFVTASGPTVPRIRRSPTAGALLDGVNAAALALMVVVTYQLGRAAIMDFTTIAHAIISGAILFRFRLNSAWLVLGGGIAGGFSMDEWTHPQAQENSSTALGTNAGDASQLFSIICNRN